MEYDRVIRLCLCVVRTSWQISTIRVGVNECQMVRTCEDQLNFLKQSPFLFSIARTYLSVLVIQNDRMNITKWNKNQEEFHLARISCDSFMFLQKKETHILTNSNTLLMIVIAMISFSLCFSQNKRKREMFNATNFQGFFAYVPFILSSCIPTLLILKCFANKSQLDSFCYH